MSEQKEEKVAQFKQGQMVTWQHNAKAEPKTGKIILVIPKGQPVLESDSPRTYGKNVQKYVAKKYLEKSQPNLGSTSTRDHRSYLVAIDNLLYWPKVENLKAAE